MTRATLYAREGVLHLLIAVGGASVLSYYFGWYAAPAWVVPLFVLQFFRDPIRKSWGDRDLICSPADGKIIAIAKENDPFTKIERLKVSIFMNVFSVHANRIPVSGTIEQVYYWHGSFFNAALDKASKQNESNAILIRTPNNRYVTCVQIAGLIARRIICYGQAQDKVEKGDRYGFIRFGSRVDLYLPLNVILLVDLGQKIRASKDHIARFVNKEAMAQPQPDAKDSNAMKSHV